MQGTIAGFAAEWENRGMNDNDLHIWNGLFDRVAKMEVEFRDIKAFYNISKAAERPRECDDAGETKTSEYIPDLKKQRDAALAERDALSKLNRGLMSERDALTQDRDRWANACSSIQDSRQRVLEANDDLRAENEKLAKDRDFWASADEGRARLIKERDELKAKNAKLLREIESMDFRFAARERSLELDVAQLRLSSEDYMAQLNRLRQELDIVQQSIKLRGE